MNAYGIVTRSEGLAEHSVLWPAARSTGMKSVNLAICGRGRRKAGFGRRRTTISGIWCGPDGAAVR